MSDMIEYMDWRGDVPFSASPLNEIDALIFTQFAYLPMENIVSGEWTGRKITVKEAGKKFFSINTEESINEGPMLIQNCSRVLRKMMESERYKDLQLKAYVSELDLSTSKQFAAITVIIDKETCFVAFRGTDDTLAGWEEDFKLCYMTPVASQVEAADYLCGVCDKFRGTIYTGGHSKGGNLAVYASMKQNLHDKERIKIIYNFDGPGFLKNIISSNDYIDIVDKIQTFMPQASIVGMMLYHDEKYSIIFSTEKGRMQHAAISWQIYGKHFVPADKFKNGSLIFSEANKSWVNEIDDKQREQFIDIIFNILKTGTSDTVSGMTADVPATINAVFKNYNDLDRTTKKMVKNTIGQMLKLSTKSISAGIKKQEKKIND